MSGSSVQTLSSGKKSDGEPPSLSLSFIDDLNPSKDMWNLKCRIIRKWVQSFRMDLILLDEKGRKIQAGIKAPLIPMFISQLHEDEVVILSRFGVGENTDAYKVINHDVAGIVVSCGDMEIFPNERKKMNLDVQDVQREVVRCTLWNMYAQEFNDFLSQNSPNETVMAVIQHARIRKWQVICNELLDMHIVSCWSIYCSDLLVKQFEAGASSSQAILSSQSVFPVRQEFLIETPKRHVDEIIEIDSGMPCVVVATIKIVQQNYGWFYSACRDCNKKVLTKIEYLQYAKTISDEVMNLSPSSLVFPKCDKECTSITIKFKVHLRVQDETGSVSFMMFDKDVMKLIGSTANDIRERQVKLDDTETFPHEISRLVEKKLAFKIEVSDYNLNHDYHVYTIQKVCDDPDIIAELVGGNGNALEVADEVFSQEGSEIKAVQLSESSQMAGADISKDVVSVMADSSVVEAEKDSATSPNGKRSLQDVEGQNVGELSSNNKRKPSRLNT
ncbi:replication protein A 70 kDa DNA-binding subunit B-like [Helianthus annuus]|uniref:replication protein A 70 kDa DNA-binding subunit B-like n=1 Tax=Helianthus annuus TaxID=4232 RepID=UPI0016532B47|nr:replication protein A 70 kDa DNA-binding subunit B-like [Helianthus annuus]